MQTFLPYSEYELCALVLDRLRLGKQRVEVRQILDTLSGKTHGWKHHPIVKMWKGYEYELIDYGVAICDEWVARGYQDTQRETILDYRNVFRECIIPPFLGDYDFHKNYRKILLAKDYKHYGQYFREED